VVDYSSNLLASLNLLEIQTMNNNRHRCLKHIFLQQIQGGQQMKLIENEYRAMDPSVSCFSAKHQLATGTLGQLDENLLAVLVAHLAAAAAG